MSSFDSRKADAQQRQRQGALAYAHFKKELARDPTNPDLLGRQAAAALDTGKRKEAVRLLEKSLRPDTDPGIFRRNLNLLVSASFQDNAHDAASRALSVTIPKWSGPGEPDRPTLGVILSLCRFLAVYKMFGKALELLESVRPYVDRDSGALEMLGAVHLHLGNADQADEVLSKARAVGGDRPSLMMATSAAAYARQDFERARLETARYVHAAPIVLTSAKPGQTTLIGVTTWRGRPISRYSTPEEVHFGTSIVGQMHELHSDRYRILSLFCESDNAVKAIAQAPKPKVIWNAAVNAEQLLRRSAIERVSTLIGMWGAPTINHPENAALTTRDAGERLYGEIPGVMVPKTRRYQKTPGTGDLVAEIEGAFDYPVIVRGLVEQEGENAFKANNREELEAAILQVRGDGYFYVIAFRESRTKQGLYRKIRAAIAGDFIQVVRVDHDEQWNVHGRKSAERAAWYSSKRELLEEEAAVCADPDAFFGLPLMQTLQAMRQRVPLDVFGIDFDITSDGRMLVFEANAAMNLLSTAAPGVEHPREAERRFMMHLHGFIASLAGAA